MPDMDQPLNAATPPSPTRPPASAGSQALDRAAVLFLVVVLLVAAVFGVLAVVLFFVGFPK